MPAPDFLDSNVLVYAYDVTHPRKQRIAQELIRKGLAGEALTSSGALGELAAILLHKISPRAKGEEVSRILDALSPISRIGADADTVRRAVEAHARYARYGIHFYDGMIVAAAERARCQRILSEDLNRGQKYFGIAVENPFG